MKGGPVVVWSVLLAVGLLSAYLSWTRGSGTGSERTVTLLDLEPDELSVLRLETGSRVLELARVQGEWWVSVTDRAPAEKREPEPGAEEGQPAAAQAESAPGSESGQKPPQPAQRRFRANQEASELAASFAPLVALRDLGTLPRERLAEFGLASPEKTLTVAHEGSEESFDVGGRAYGSPHLYLRRRRDGRVFLTRARPLSQLEDSEARLLDRRLHRFALADVDRVVVSSGGRQRELVRRSEAGSDSFWVAADAAEERNDLYGSWLQKAHQLFVSELLPPGTPGAPTPVVTIEYYQGAGKRGQLELRSEPAQDEGARRYRARSEHTSQWVRVEGAEADAVARDVENVLAR